MAGPELGYLLSGRVISDIVYYDIESGTEDYSKVDLKRGPDEIKELDLNRLDFSLNAGIGCETDFRIGKLFLNVNYIWGLTESRKNDSDINDGVTEYNRGLSTILGFLIPLKK